MSSPPRMTFPSTRVLGIVSCIRFRQRIRVDLPQPDGPMIAETACSSKSSVMSSMAFLGPYHADNPSVRTFAAILTSPRHGTKPDDHAGRDADAEHHEDEDEGGAPSGLVQRGVGAEREHVDGVRERLARLIQAPEPKGAAQARHEQWCRLSSDPGNPKESPCDDRAACGG